MVNKVRSGFRKVAPLLSAGVLFQAAGCNFDSATLVNGLVSSVLNSIVTDLVFGVFNLPV